ncbi:glycoside hydrolase family 95 protein [Candidatus Poribacteria bacterium]|nr:glycoside hydrolase family 95 protein [Candidatus Poribacteria bacterium]MBT7097596.1 glycoside hydrolase family 95 protein [Candidatus Poribacteria bacterium]MBT7809414.1 glycoside hydrolase family 95 protein [Candidatus Poribacteria bacterium]
MTPTTTVSPMSATERDTIAPARGMSSLYPAERWEDALITGNGTLGALVFGNPYSERVVLNHERFNLPQWKSPPEPPDIAHALPEIRRLMLDGHYAEAYAHSIEAARDDGWDGIEWTDMYHPGHALCFDVASRGTPGDYVRSLDFETGEIVVRWRDGLGEWTRRSFASRADGVIVQLLRAPSDGPLHVEINADERLHALPEAVRFEKRVTQDTLELRGRYPSETGGGGFTCATRVVPTGGTCYTDGQMVKVRDADSVLLLTRLEWHRDAGERAAQNLRESLDAVAADYDALLGRHAAIHGEMFGRVRLDLGASPARSRSAEELLEAQDEDVVNPALLETMFDMGRYVLISSSGEWPPRLTGIWNASWNPSWRGDFTTDANVNLAVSGGNTGSLPEAMEGYFRLVEGIFADWETNARKFYGCRGVLAGPRTDGNHNLHRHFDEGFPGHFWLSGAGWLYQPFLEHYQVTGDETFLRERLIPALVEIAAFYEDFLTTRDENGKLVFVPSYSPENAPANTGCPAAINATMDIAVCRETLSTLVASCENTGEHPDAMPRWRAILDALPPYLVNEDGALREWAWRDLADEYNHRHLSHLYPLWPGLEIDVENTPEFFEAARVAANLRGQGNRSAHGLMHMALVAARLKDGDIVHRNLTQILHDEFIYRSLVTSHNPGHHIYNVDAGTSLPAVVMEMLVSSRPGVIEFLPALHDAVPRGSITGVECRTQATVDRLGWDLSARVVDAMLRSRVDQTVTVMLRRGIESFTVSGETLASHGRHGSISRDVPLRADVPTALRVTWAAK